MFRVKKRIINSFLGTLDPSYKPKKIYVQCKHYPSFIERVSIGVRLGGFDTYTVKCTVFLKTSTLISGTLPF